ncbi:MAG TPA: ATP synthase F1 subunit epsilon [Miltoncostaea sp.]|nr:ATP synthase F1 subunit epsilon [Miltoncostaea sp.]
MSTAVGQDRKRIGVRLLTPEGAVYDDLAYMVIAPSIEGEVGILPRHTPFIAFLRPGEVRIKLLDDTEVVYATTEGYVSVEEDRVLILTEQAERADEIDVERARAALERAEADLADAGDDEVRRTTAESARRRAENRLRVAEKG